MNYSHPNEVICNICGGKYFTCSIKIHQKKCKYYFDVTHDPCKLCGRMVHKYEMYEHVALCKKMPQNQLNQIKGRGVVHTFTSMNQGLQGLRDSLGRTACSVCKRKFTQDRIVTHENICRRRMLQSQGPKPVVQNEKQQQQLQDQKIKQQVFKGASYTLQQSQEDNKWRCESCSFLNESSRAECKTCGEDKENLAEKLELLLDALSEFRVECGEGEETISVPTLNQVTTTPLFIEISFNCLSRVLQILENIQKYPDQDRLKNIKTQNKIFQMNIGKYKKAVEVLIVSGFKLINEDGIEKYNYQGSNKLLDMSVTEIKNTLEKLNIIKEQFSSHRVQCNICGRKFHINKITYHETVCSKNRRNREFNAKFFRLRNTEFEASLLQTSNTSNENAPLYLSKQKQHMNKANQNKGESGKSQAKNKQNKQSQAKQQMDKIEQENKSVLNKQSNQSSQINEKQITKVQYQEEKKASKTINEQITKNEQKQTSSSKQQIISTKQIKSQTQREIQPALQPNYQQKQVKEQEKKPEKINQVESKKEVQQIQQVQQAKQLKEDTQKEQTQSFKQKDIQPSLKENNKVSNNYNAQLSNQVKEPQKLSQAQIVNQKNTQWSSLQSSQQETQIQESEQDFAFQDFEEYEEPQEPQESFTPEKALSDEENFQENNQESQFDYKQLRYSVDNFNLKKEEQPQTFKNLNLPNVDEIYDSDEFEEYISSNEEDSDQEFNQQKKESKQDEKDEQDLESQYFTKPNFRK